MFLTAQKMWTTTRAMNVHVVRNSPKGSNLHAAINLNSCGEHRHSKSTMRLLFLSGWMIKCSGAQWVSHEFFCFCFLPGWMGRCSGAWLVNHEGFYQGEWGGEVEHGNSRKVPESTGSGTGEKYWIKQQWKSTRSGNSGKVPDLSTLQLHSFRDTGSSPPKKVSRPANIKRCKLQAP